jgi:TonB family protein
MRARQNQIRPLLAALGATAVVTGAPRGHAQDAQTATSDAGEPPARPNLTPPVLQYDRGVLYPKQAIDEGLVRVVVVTLVVGIGSDGAVTSAEVEQPAGHGFDEAATAAARDLRFEPAKRQGVSVASRIRFQYTFTPPSGAISGEVRTLTGDRPIAGATVTARDALGTERATTTGADGAWRIDRLPPGAYHVTIVAPEMQTREVDETLGPGREERAIDRLAPSVPAKPSPASGAGAVAPEAEEVDVRGRRPPREVTVFALDQREINRIPGTSGDALHSLENLPGVARPPALSGLLIVRGSAPQDSQYFVDGTPIPIVYHFGGLFSVLPTEAIDRIDFYPGNFSTQYGRAMGGIVDVGLAEPKGDRLHGLAEVNLIDARVLAQGPVFDTGWKFLVAGRRSYVDTWLGPLLNSLGSNVSVAPVYYDYQAIVERDLGPRSSLRFAFFGSDDRLALLLSSGTQGAPTLAGQLSDHTGFWRAQGLYKLRLNDRTQVRVVVGAGQDFVSFTAGNIYFNLTDWPITGRAEVSQKLDPRLTMNVGLDVGYGPYTVSARLPPLPTPGTPPSGPFSSQAPLQTKSTAAIYEPAAYVEWEATPWRGARIVPGIRLDYTKDTHAWDLDPRIVVRQDVTTAPRTTLKAGVGLFSQPPQPQETNAVFGTPGLTSNRAYHYDLGIEHEFTRHIDGSVEGFYKQLDHLVTQNLGNTGSGVIYGAEVLLRYKPDEHFFGWLAYTLSRSVRRDAPGAPLMLSEFDETHVLTVLGSYRLGHGWEFGARFRLTSGYMFTPAQYGYYDENVGSYVALQAYPQFGSRLPLFHSLDLRVDKTWRFSWGSFAMYLDVLNVYNNANVDGISYNYNSTLSSHVGDLPILPSLGLRLEM